MNLWGIVAGCFCLPSWFEHVATPGILVRRHDGVSRKECEIDQCASKSIIKSNQIQGASPPSVSVNRPFPAGTKVVKAASRVYRC